MGILDDPKKLLVIRIVLGIAFAGWWGFFIISMFFREPTTIEIYSLSNDVSRAKNHVSLSISNCVNDSRPKGCQFYITGLKPVIDSWTSGTLHINNPFNINNPHDIYIRVKGKVKARVLIKFRKQFCYETIIETANDAPMVFRLRCTPN